MLSQAVVDLNSNSSLQSAEAKDIRARLRKAACNSVLFILKLLSNLGSDIILNWNRLERVNNYIYQKN
jgi:hypothetical protein